MTYSVVARDPATGELGVASQSHYFAVARAVNHAEAGTGAVANQSFIEPAHAQRGLAAMRAGASAEEALRATLAADPEPDVRQVAMADARGGLAVHTGARCVPTAGSRAGDGYLVQGNMLASEAVLDGMARAMDESGPLADRMLRALAAADSAGGDLRGRQAAGIRIVSGEPDGAVVVDLRVDDAPDPVGELTRLVLVQRSTTALRQALRDAGVTGEIRPDAVDPALDTLGAIAGEDSEAGVEAELWRCVLLARAGRDADAAVRALVARRPSMETFLANLAAAGVLR
ncbi:DUF1028 domain-containing protein [Amycolatopsis jejuensis]|uniref:DUF1028 domain-containing protein n=1 Tax=Amycolatopsis jejuensis TaxID=330084 RepID=UPI0005271689|nr:DUF1028 domain-containing protein [Amycolatopsis jejuensis]